MVLHIETIGQDGEESGKDDEYDSHYLVLLFEISHRTLAYIGSYLLHSRSALVLFEHPLVKIERKSQCDERGNRHQPE